MGDFLLNLLSNRLLVILILLGLILLSAFFVYYFFLQKENSLPEDRVLMTKEKDIVESIPRGAVKQEEKSDRKTAPLAFGQTRALSSNEAVDIWLSSDGRHLRYLSEKKAAVYEIHTQTKKDEVFTSFTPNLLKTLWSLNGLHLINIFKQNGKLNKYSYNLLTRENILLDSNFKYIVWSPEGEKIAYHYFNSETEEGFISVAEPDGKNWKNLTPVLSRDLNVEWPHRNKISFYEFSLSSLAASDLSIINPEAGEPPQKILSQKYGLKTNWSPSGNKLLFSSSESAGTNPKLFILNETLEEKSLDIECLADKCAWSKSEENIYCALPQNLTKDISLPQDWYSNKFLSQDILFKIELDSGKKTQITQNPDYDFSNLLVSLDENFLYFINKESGFLYETKL